MTCNCNCNKTEPFDPFTNANKTAENPNQNAVLTLEAEFDVMNVNISDISDAIQNAVEALQSLGWVNHAKLKVPATEMDML